MSHKPRYIKGNWLADCDACGKTFYSAELRKRWDGYMVCNLDWEIRQPQDFVRGIADTQAPPWVRPEVQDQFVLACTTRTSLPGYATPTCMIAGNTVNLGSVPSPTFTP